MGTNVGTFSLSKVTLCVDLLFDTLFAVANGTQRRVVINTVQCTCVNQKKRTSALSKCKFEKKVETVSVQSLGYF